MAPITINSDKPISSTAAQKAHAPTSETQDSTSSSRYTPATTTPSSTSQYTPAAPGAAAAPAPTGTAYTHFPPAVMPPPTRTTDIPEAQSGDAPPPPQPGAVPQPPTTSTPPQPTSTMQSPPSVTQLPPQSSISPPTSNYAPTKSTVPTNTSNHANPYAPTQLFRNADAASTPVPSLSHPPGYTQNPDAAEMTSSQRALQEQREAQESYLRGLGSGGSIPGPSVAAGVGTGSGEGSMGEMAGSAWNVAKAWAGSVAEKAEEVEHAVWRRVNEGK